MHCVYYTGSKCKESLMYLWYFRYNSTSSSDWSNIYSLDCICWLVPIVADSSVFIRSNIVSNQWISPLKARSIRTSLNQGTSMQRQSVYFYSSGGIFESGTRSSFTINSTQLQMFAYILASSLEWCTSKRYSYKPAFVKIFSTKFEG